MTTPQTASSIEVAIRVRPLRGELHESKPAWQVDAASLTELAQPDNVFTFDRVYDTNATTAEIYANNVRHSIVTRVAQGYNGTVFAYGQTGSGKSFTMFGDASPNGRSPGLIRLAVHDLFAALAAEHQRKPYMHTEIFVSVLEIYNEQLRDLLQSDSRNRAFGGPLSAGSPTAASPIGASSSSSPAPPLSIRENEYGVYVHNALRTAVTSEEECTRVIYTHAASRVSAATLMNEHSSRSHCVIRILVERSHYLEDSGVDEDEEEEEGDDATTQADDDDDRASSTHTGASGGRRSGTAKKASAAKHKKKVISTLNMVDLAGSERVAKTGATGLRMIEGGHINKSLTTLTTVINRLASDASGAPHSTAAGAMPGRANGGSSGAATFIPYRDSRLTHLLKTAIGGNSFTAVLCCITPAIESANESRSTLQFASRAKKIKNKVRVNEVANTQTRLRELEAALRSTKKLLVAQTLYLWSKQLKIRKYEAQLASAGAEGLERASPAAAAQQGTSATLHRIASTENGSGSMLPRGSAATLMNQQQQQQMIIAQLSAQNDALREEVSNLKAQLKKALAEVDERRNGSTTSVESSRAAAAAEVATVRRSLQSAQGLLKERETALQAAQASLDELDGLCRELEGENKSQAEQIKALTARTNEAEELMNAVEEEQASQQQEIGLLRTQLQQSQAKLLEKHRGDDYLAELTKLHVEHQNLQYSYNQMKEKADRDKAELMQRLHRLTERNNSLEDDLDEVKDEAQLRNSYLWRLLGAAAQVTQGKPLTIKDTAAAVRDAQVGEAVRALTSFALLSANAAVESTDAANGNGRGGASGDDVRQLQSRVRGLEEQLIAKDAQRDVIIDTKLKRIQGLVLRLHAVNVALVEEMRHCFHDNEVLFETAMKSSKTQKKIEKAGLTQRSLESALDRARFTQPPHKPLYHN